MTNEELIAELRQLAVQIDPLLLGGPDARLLNKAADEIERLTAQLAEEQRISNLRGDTINKMLDQMAEADQQLAEARQAERAAVVAWLRGQVTCGCGRDDCIEDGYPLAYATAIEAGEHLA